MLILKMKMKLGKNNLLKFLFLITDKRHNFKPDHEEYENSLILW